MSKTLDYYLERSAVIGAAGKMGCGIAALLAREMTLGWMRGDLERPRLVLVDTDEARFGGLMRYLKDQLRKYAERNLALLETLSRARSGPDQGQDLASYFVDVGMRLIDTSVALESVTVCRLAIEAVFESKEVKRGVFERLGRLCSEECLFMSNTSSIPLGAIEGACGLEGRILGLHFYNPPVVQKLIELIPSQRARPENVRLAEELARRLGKTSVRSADVAGFIGNGHFAREGVMALRMVEEISCHGLRFEAISFLNHVVERLLARPMGIFQTIDYVGLDVFDKICEIMEQDLGECFRRERLRVMLHRGIKGGQDFGGRQKDGFFRYGETGEILGVYCIAKGLYEPVRPLEDESGILARSIQWKDAIRRGDAWAEAHFESLAEDRSWPGRIAWLYARRSRGIAARLVDSGVASSSRDVDTTLKLGFYHPYGILEVIPPQDVVAL